MPRKMTYLGLAIALAVGAAAAASYSANRARRKDLPVVVKAPPFDLLAYIDERILAQENVKDVRCWSSVSRLQMFLAKAPIEPEARAARIERYHDLLESLWQSTRGAARDGEIRESAVTELLDRRFPKIRDGQGSVSFTGSGDFGVLCIPEVDIRNYSDTIESWRLIQSWVLRHTDASGRVQLDPTFSKSAVQKVAEFVVIYDLAILRYSRQVAMEHKRSTVDEASMVEAFTLESRLVECTPATPK